MLRLRRCRGRFGGGEVDRDVGGGRGGESTHKRLLQCIPKFGVEGGAAAGQVCCSQERGQGQGRELALRGCSSSSTLYGAGFQNMCIARMQLLLFWLILLRIWTVRVLERVPW